MDLHLDEWQEKFLNTTGDKILCTGRQVGKSVVCAMDCAKWATRTENKGKNALMIAPTERQAFELFDKTLDHIADKYRHMLKMGKDRPTKTKIKLKNGVTILCLPTGLQGLGIRGLTVHRLYIDEMSRLGEDVMAAVTPMLLTTGGDSIYLSTPFGAQGEFWRCWVNKDNAYNSFTRFSTDSEDVVRNRKICDTWTELQREKALLKLEQAKARMSNREYAQEYLGHFVEDLMRYFTDDLLKDICVLKRRLYIQKNADYYMGCDIARMGEDEGTYEIFHKINQETLEQVENIVTKKQLTTQTEEKIIELTRRYNLNKIYIDAGSGTLGVSVFDHLLKHPTTSRKVVAINNRARVYDRDEKAKTKLLKEDLYDNLRSLMEKGQIKLLDDENLIESFRSVQYEYVQKDNYPTRLRIFGDYTHIVEGIVRAAWCQKEKQLNIWVRSIKV